MDIMSVHYAATSALPNWKINNSKTTKYIRSDVSYMVNNNTE